MTPPPDAGPDGGSCDGGLCPPEKITGELMDLWDLASDEANLYWLDNGNENAGLFGQLVRQSKSVVCLKADAGCSTDLTPDPQGLFRVDTLTVGNGHVCWTDGQETARDLRCLDTTTNNLTVVARSQAWATGPRWFGTTLWWVDQTDTGTLQHSDLATGPVTFVGRPNPTSVVVTADTVAWTETGVGSPAVLSRPLAGGSSTPIAIQQQAPRSLVACGDALVWVDFGKGTVMKGTTAANSGAPIVSNQQRPLNVVCDATHVYWLNAGLSQAGTDGSLWQARLDGTEVLPMVQAIQLAAGLTQDDTYVYFGASGVNTGSGAIWRMRKHP